MNSNELNQKVLDACLDPACFQILYAYITLGGWNPEQEVFLPQTYWRRWGLNRRTLTRHRPHLVESGWLSPTDNLSREGNCKYRVTVPEPISPTPDANMAQPLRRIGPPPAPGCPTEVINTNVQSNEQSNEIERVSDAPGTPGDISLGKASSENESSSGLIPKESAGAVAVAPDPGSLGRRKTRVEIEQGLILNRKSNQGSVAAAPNPLADKTPAGVARDPANPTELEIGETMAALRRFHEVYAQMKPADLREAAISRLSWPLTAERNKREQERRDAYAKAVAAATAAQKAAAVDW